MDMYIILSTMSNVNGHNRLRSIGLNLRYLWSSTYQSWWYS